MKINKKYFLIALAIILIVTFVFLFFSRKTDDLYQDYTDNQEILDKQLKDKIGQMLIVGFRGTEIKPDSYIKQAIIDLNLGGVILFDYDVPSNGEVERNILNPQQTQKLISDLKKISPLFIAVDAEGGYINRLKERDGFIYIPSAQEMGQMNPERTKEYAFLLGKQLKEIGFNLNFTPVVDVNINPQNPIIGNLKRSFSNNPETVIKHALSFIQGLNENDIVSAIKHFPGHGSSEKDSHLGIVDVTNVYKQQELLPYKEIISQGYSDMIMTAHIINTNIDPQYPATLSPLFLQEILRKELEFQGIIISDDMQMGAIIDNYGYDEAIIKAINAGCDMLIISNNGSSYDEQDVYKAVDIIFNAVKNQEISQEKINQSYNKIIELKRKYKIII